MISQSIRWSLLLVVLGTALGFVLRPQSLNSATPLAVLLSLPPGGQLKAQSRGNEDELAQPLEASREASRWQLTLRSAEDLPLQILARGPFGSEWSIKIASLLELQNFQIPIGIETQQASNPDKLTVLPQLCPRLETTQPSLSKNSAQPEFLYLGEQDRLNHRPTFQLLDPDATQGKQPLTVQSMDGRNVLLVKQIRVRHDYEDSTHVEFEKTNPNTGEVKQYLEDERGFYANFQYAVVPYSPDLDKADSQTLLHLGQGSLAKVGQEKLIPEMRTRSFLPGPYLSKKEYLYELCEWGDTAKHAKEQHLNYQNLALWDWDYPLESSSDANKVLLIVWESDEEHLDHNFAHFPKNYLIDDLIGVFTIDRQNSLQPLTLRNTQGDFEITVQTGDFRGKG